MALTSGWFNNASTAVLSPCTTLKTPFGRPASSNHLAANKVAEGSLSEGLSTNVLPAAIATGYIHIGTIAGKLNGVMPAHTPSAWRMVHASMPLAICSVYSPFKSWGMPQAKSTTSKPRWISPLASSNVLPCSRVITSAISSMRASMMALKLNITLARRVTGVLDQAGKAALAAATALATPSTDANSTFARTWPVAGSYTGAVEPPKRMTSPLIWCPIVSDILSPTSFIFLELQH